MALDLPELHEQALVWTDRVVTGLRKDQFDHPTPCADWNVYEVLNHIVSGNWWVPPLVEGLTIEEVGSRLDGNVLGDDAVAAYEQSAKSAAEAFFRPGAMANPVAVSYGPVPGSRYCGDRIVDVTIHGWDLAKATGQDTWIPEDLVEACRQIFAPIAEDFRGAGVVGPPPLVPDGSSSQVQLLAAFGRQA